MTSGVNWYGSDGKVLHQTMKDSADATASWEKGFVYIAGKLAGYSETHSGVTKRYWVQTDQLGTVVRETDEAGIVTGAQEYATFGTDPGTVVTGVHEMLQWYTGKEWDGDLGLYYFNARWYDPDIGRFITEDPVRDDSNWYVYCLNSPETWVDPSGLENSNPIAGSPGPDGGTEVTYSDGTKQNFRGTPFMTPSQYENTPHAPDSPVASMSVNNDGSITVNGINYAGRRGTLANGQTKSGTSPEQGTVPAPSTDVGNDNVVYEEPQIENGVEFSMMNPFGLLPEFGADDRPENPLSQNDPSLRHIPYMERFGCKFRENQMAVEDELGINLTAKEIAESVERLKRTPDRANTRQMVIGDEMIVNNPDQVIDDAFDILGYPDRTGTVGWGGGEGWPDYTELKGKTVRGGIHFILGDQYGRPLIDPLLNDKGFTVVGNPVGIYFH